MKKRLVKGFTLIELLIVIAIIGILSGLAVAGLQGNLARARDTQRRNDLKQLQNALQAYYNDHNSYPSVAGWTAESGVVGAPTANYIPGLAPTYIRKLPSDPLLGKPNSYIGGGCLPTTAVGYAYYSNGTDYKLVDVCGPESPLKANDALNNAAGTWAGYSYMISTDSAVGW